MQKLERRSALFDQNVIDVKKRTARIVWSTGAKVLRSGWKSAPVYEELDMSRDAVDLSFLNNKGSLLIDHNSSSVKNIVGVVEVGSAEIVDGSGIATVRFGTDVEADMIFQKVRDGLISKVSVGYSIDKTEIKRSQNEDYDTIMVTKWTPKEISLVVFPADSEAGIRSGELDQIRKDEKLRISEIERAVRIAGLPQDFSRRMIESDVNIDEARAQIFSELERNTRSERYIPAVTGGNPVDSIEKRNEAISNAILHRYDPQNTKLDESSARYRNSSLCDIARFVTNSNAFCSKSEIIERALSTSDFPILLKNILNKSLRREYDLAEKTWEPLVRKTVVPDFKPIERVQIGDAPILLPKSENGQYQQGSFSDAGETYALREWGRIISITRKTLVNDDLHALLRLPSMLSRRSAELEADLAWGSILNSPKMGDGFPLFDSKHNNYTKTGSVISVQSVGEAKRSMRMQRGLNGGRINIIPRYLIVPTALEAVAQQFLFPTVPNMDQSVNPFKSSLKLIVDPRLDDVSTTAWYLAADLGQIDLIEMAYLQGQEGLYMEQKIDFNTDGIQLKVRMDIESKAIDWRGFYKNEGVKI